MTVGNTVHKLSIRRYTISRCWVSHEAPQTLSARVVGGAMENIGVVVDQYFLTLPIHGANYVTFVEL